ncbi:MAG TPA: adenylate/guanylate cyclase domain-containing protein [Chryseolinea sp.]|nr:adenylate/guanylate cyclase domain-containing protein [Chryseolinea sp.]
MNRLPEDTSKVNRLIELGDLYLEVDLKSALKYGTQAIALANDLNYLQGLGYGEKLIGRVSAYQDDYPRSIEQYEKALKIFESIDFKEGIAIALTSLAKIHFRSGNYSKSMEYTKRSLKINEDLKDQLGIAVALNDVAVIYLGHHNYPKALDYYKASLKISEKYSYEKEIAISLGNIGAIYFYEGDYSKALDYYQRSLDMSEEISRNEGIGANLVNIGEVYYAYGDYSKALDYYERSLTFCDSILDRSGAAYALNNIGASYQNQKDYRNALANYKRSLKIREEIFDKDGATETLLNIGKLSLEKGDVYEAITWCEKSRALAKQIDDIYSQRDACNCLYSAYKIKGENNKALAFHELMQVLEDSLNVKETNRKLQQFEFAKQQLEDSVNQAEKERLVQESHLEEVNRKNRTRNIAIGSGLLLLIFAGGLYSRLNYIRKSKNIIEKERDNSNNLLLNILPKEVADELKASGESRARNYDEVTVLFTDFKDFTNIAETLGPQDLVAEINACFKAFDQIITKYGIEKIKTIGDSYMAVGGLNSSSSQSAKTTIMAAMDMQEFMLTRGEDLAKLGKPHFEMRAGIHTGPVVAGIVGVKKFQYDIWGDTVNIASRMESSGTVNKVNISQHTYELVKSDTEFTFEFRGKVQAKSLGLIEMYFVGRRTF